MTNRLEQDHELITFELSKIDRVVVWYSIIGAVLMCFALDWLTTFQGVWIWGMPRSAFGIVLVGGIIGAVVISIQYPVYKRYFDKLEKERG